MNESNGEKNFLQNERSEKEDLVLQNIKILEMVEVKIIEYAACGRIRLVFTGLMST